MKKFRVFFCSDGSNPPANDEGLQFFLFKTLDNWNDFYVRTVFELKVFDGTRLILHDSNFTKIIFRSEKEEKEILAMDRIRVKDVSYEFYSMAATQQAYDTVLGTLGLSSSIVFFKVIKDLGILNRRNERDRTVFSKEMEDVLYKSLLRNPYPYLVYKGSKSVFEISDNLFRPHLTCKFRLPDCENDHMFNMKFEVTPMGLNRMGVIVGKNGVGKSQTMRNVCIHEISKILELEDLSRAPVFNRVLAVSNIQDDVFPRLDELPKNGEIFYKYINLQRNAEDHSSSESLMNILRDVELLNQTDSKFSILQKVLKGIVDFEDVFLPVIDGPHEFNTMFIDGKQFISMKDFNNMGEKRQLLMSARIRKDLKPLVIKNRSTFESIYFSTGQAIFFSLACRILSSVSSNSLILVEEPETYLHPNFEIDFFRLLKRILEETNSYALLSTHSVFIVRELLNTQVRVVTKEDRRVSFSMPTFQTFGASLDALSDYVFGDLEKHKGYESAIEVLMNEKVEFDTISRFLGDDAMFYLMNNLRKGRK